MSTATKHLLHLKPTHELIVIRLLVSLGQAVAIAGLSLFFLDIGLTDSQVGLFTGFATLVVALLFLFLPPLLERFNQLTLLKLSMLIGGSAFMLLALAEVAVLAMLLYFLMKLSMATYESSKSILFKDATRSNEEFAKDTGLSGSVGNLGWFLGPLLGGLMLDYAGFDGLFLMSGLFVVAGAVYLALFPFKTRVKKRTKLDTSIVENIRFYLSKPLLTVAYFQRMGISVWWGFVWAFMPIFMLKAGYSTAAIGFFIAFTQLPLFFLEFKTVKLVPRFGYKKIFTASYGLLAVICLVSFFSPSLWFSIVVITIGSLSLSFLEPISELFFYKQVVLNDEERAYPVFSTASSAGAIAARVGVGALLAVFVDRAAFALIGIVMAFIAYQATRIGR